MLTKKEQAINKSYEAIIGVCILEIILVVLLMIFVVLFAYVSNATAHAVFKILIIIGIILVGIPPFILLYIDYKM